MASWKGMGHLQRWLVMSLLSQMISVGRLLVLRVCGMEKWETVQPVSYIGVIINTIINVTWNMCYCDISLFKLLIDCMYIWTTVVAVHKNDGTYVRVYFDILFHISLDIDTSRILHVIPTECYGVLKYQVAEYIDFNLTKVALSVLLSTWKLRRNWLNIFATLSPTKSLVI